MQPDEKPPLLQLALASIYIDDLARGVQGSFVIEEEGLGEGNAQVAVNEIQDCQILLHKKGWRRDKRLEKLAPFNTRNVEVAIYWKQFPDHDAAHFVQINLTTRFGIHATFIGKR